MHAACPPPMPRHGGIGNSSLVGCIVTTWADIVATVPTRSDWRAPSDAGLWVNGPLVPIMASWLQPGRHTPWYAVSVSGFLMLAQTDENRRDYLIVATSETPAPPPETPVFLGWPYEKVYRDAVSLLINGSPLSG